MALILPGVLVVFTVSSFEFQLTALISLLMMNGPNSPSLKSLDYQVCEQC